MPRSASSVALPGIAVLLGLALLVLPARADHANNDPARNYAPGHAPAATAWYDILPAGALAAAVQADRDYVVKMRRHHAGALSMSREYLADPQGSSAVLKALAQAIIANQSYEIALLDAVARRLDEPARRIGFGLVLRPVGAEGLGEEWGVMQVPTPSRLDALAGGPVTARDVQFARAMSIHHQAALEMARGYNADPAARNDFLRLLNVNIVTDQTQEIALMGAVTRAYPGDAAAVPVPPDMVHGMEGMQDHGAAPGAAPDAPGGHRHHH